MNTPNITYTIKITKTEHNVPYKYQAWKQVVDQPDEKHDEIYRYVETDSTKDTETEIFQQTLETLNLAKVVLVINESSN